MTEKMEQCVEGMYASATEKGQDKGETVLKDLPQEKAMSNAFALYYYNGFWVPDMLLGGVVSAQKNFMARDDDIILTSCPKSGTTWLKSLAFSILHRGTSNDGSSLADSHLLKENPHNLVPFLEGRDLAEFEARNLFRASYPTPRLINTHISYELLPSSIKTSSCKIVYISRNPMDQFISLWHFIPKVQCSEGEPSDLEEGFEKFCRGIHGYGPFWDHVLGFWKASLETPQKVLFLKYEDLKKCPVVNVKRLAEFIGFPFSEEEEKNGVVEKIVELCSIEKLKNLEINKNGSVPMGMPNSSFFRKGEVGDSKNFLSPTMMECMEKLMQEKYGEHYSSLKSSF